MKAVSWAILAGVWTINCFVGTFEGHELIIALLCLTLAFETAS